MIFYSLTDLLLRYLKINLLDGYIKKDFKNMTAPYHNIRMHIQTPVLVNE